VDRALRQLELTMSLMALSDSVARESLHIGADGSTMAPLVVEGHRLASPIEVAYATRWIELDGGHELRGWRHLCRSPRR
jgi:hypothetical protein